jgi:hypothetical protein
MHLPQTPCRCRVDRVKRGHHTFSAENLPEIPPVLVTSDLVITKTEHSYGNCCRIDKAHFYGSGQTHRELVILILATLFSGKGQRVTRDLEHEASRVKRLQISCSGLSRSACWDYARKPGDLPTNGSRET